MPQKKISIPDPLWERLEKVEKTGYNGMSETIIDVIRHGLPSLERANENCAGECEN